MKSYTIDTRGNKRECLPENGSFFQLEELYQILGCNSIQILQTVGRDYMIVDEEGKLNPKNQKNTWATLLYEHGSQDSVVGKVLVCKQHQIQ